MYFPADITEKTNNTRNTRRPVFGLRQTVIQAGAAKSARDGLDAVIEAPISTGSSSLASSSTSGTSPSGPYS
jgi:hypothetical protein